MIVAEACTLGVDDDQGTQGLEDGYDADEERVVAGATV